MSIYNNVIMIPTSLDGDFFKRWVESLRFIHHLTDGEMNMLSIFLKKHYELSKVVSDNVILNELLFGEKTRKEIRSEMNISLQHFQVVFGKLKKAGVITDEGINPKLIPNINDKSIEDGFNLLIYFNFKK